MATHVTSNQIKEVMLTELPVILKTDPEIRRYILEITQERYTESAQTDHRLERMFAELKQERQERAAELEQERQERIAWMEKQEVRWAHWEQKWEAERKEQAEKWQENQHVIQDMLASIKAIATRQESSIGALGARWGLRAESAFRDGLKAILEESFHVTVERYEDFDYDGKVFGRPEQIELDIIIYDSTLILCEIKSSISKSQMYTFWRKCQFYEEKHQCQAQRAIVISPMVEESAKKVAQELKIEVYGYADEVPVTR